MTRRINWWLTAAMISIPLMLSSSATAQDEFEVWAPGDDKLWTNDDNWTFGGELSGAPSVSNERGGQQNGNTLIIDADVDTAGFIQNGGTMEIQSGSLTSVKTDIQSGVTTFNGNVIISGGAKLTGPDTKTTFGGKSTLQLLAADAAFEAKGDLSMGGSLLFPITGAGNPVLTVAGEAAINGPVVPTFDGVTPAFGDSWKFLDAGSVNVGSKANVVLPGTVSLPKGLNARVQSDAKTASLVIGNLPILEVNRANGAASITNVVGGDVVLTGYSITSDRGLLNGAGFTGTGTDGFVTPNPINTSLAEFSLEGTQTIAVGEVKPIGNAYNGGATHPNDEDVLFQFSTESGDIINGLVDYLGPANDIVLNANPETNEVTLYHLSTHLDPVDITAYTLTSAGGSLNAADWTSIASGDAAWTEANPTGAHISELNLSSAKTFSNGTVVSLGNIYGGTPDLRLQYATDSAIFDATITYGLVPDGGGTVCAPSNALLGDIDGNGTVAFPDFLILADNFGKNVGTYGEGDVDCNGTVAFPDFLILAENFGKSLGQGAAASVPEPNAGMLLGFGAGLLLTLRRRRRSHVAVSATSTTPTERCQMTNWKPALIALVVIVASIATTQQAKADLLAYYAFEDGSGTTVSDLSGNDFHAEASDAFTFSEDGFQGAAGDFGEFNNGAVVLFPEEFATGDNGFNKIVESQEVTISYWLNRQGDDATDAWTFLFGGSRQLGSHAPWSNSNVYFDIAGCCGPNQRINADMGGADTDGEWHHLAYVKRKDEGADKAVSAIYLDGAVLVSSPGWDGNGDPTIDDVVEIDAASIGGDNGGGSSHNGLIDSFAIWNEALEEGQILALADGASPLGPQREPPGDFNEDGKVDLADFAILAANMGDRFAFAEQPVNLGDMNGDLRVNLKDFLDFRNVFNSQGAAGAASSVPEPNSLLLLTLALVGISLRRRTRR